MPSSDRPSGTARWTQKQRTGLAWEDAASRYLQRRGLRVLKRRYRCRVGELDLVCLDGTTLVIVEVRARSKSRFADAAESVNENKRRKLVRATQHLLMTHPQWATYPVRFDIFSANDIDTNPSIHWIRNAFGTDGVA